MVFRARKKPSVSLYAREAPFYLEKVKKLKIIVHKKVSVQVDPRIKTHVEDFFYLVKLRTKYYVYFHNIQMQKNAKAPLYMLASFEPTTDPLIAITNFRNVGSQKEYDQWLKGAIVRKVSYKSYSGKNSI